MTRHNVNELLSYEVIKKAVRGDVEAVNAVLKHYGGYITKLSLRVFYDESGYARMYIDEELRCRIETKLITKIFTFRVD